MVGLWQLHTMHATTSIGASFQKTTLESENTVAVVGTWDWP